jgi:hypothetical protein
MHRIQHVKDERLRRLIQHWLDLRGGRAMPGRAEMDPVEIHYVLPYLWLYDFVPPEDFRCRLLGDRIIELWGKNPKGRSVKEIFPETHAPAVIDSLMVIVRTSRFMHSFSDVTTTDRMSVRGERIALPLSSDGVGVDAILGATIYDWGREPARGGLFASEAMAITYTSLD